MLIRLLSVLILFSFTPSSIYAQDHTSEASVQVLLPEVQDMNLLSTWQTGNQEFNDIWGYVDSQGREYAIIGSRSHYYFVDITNPTNPQLVDGFAGGNTTIWRDMKTYGQWAYGVCDNCSEGLSIFRLGDSPASNGVQMVTQTTSFFTRAHNIFVDEPNGRMYVLGSNTQSSGVIILDIQTNPEVPIFLGASNLPGGYIHDMYVRDNIAYADSGPNGLYVYDMSNPTSIQTLGSLTSYPQQGYNHASWLNDAGDVLIMADETHNRSVKAVDVSDLSDIEVTSLFRSELLAPAATGSIAHNPFVRDNYAVISYYHDGVQIFDISNPANVEQVAWYDTFAGNTNYNGFDGCWGVYPFLPSGNIIGSDGTGGLFVLEPTNITFSPIPPVQPPFGFVNETVGTCISQGTAVSLSLTTDADVIQWFRNGSLIDVRNNITATSEGTYQAIVYKGPHSLTLDPIEIVFGDAPVVEQILPDTELTICGDAAADLLVITDVADSYTWSLDGVVLGQFTGNRIGVEEPGVYTVMIEANGCETTVEFVVAAQEAPEAILNFDETQILCEGESLVLESVEEGDSYAWSIQDFGGFTTIDGETSSSLTVTDTGIYRVEVAVGGCVSNSEAVGVVFSEVPEVSLNAITAVSFCQGETFVIESSLEPITDPIIAYDWRRDGELIQSSLETNLTVSEAGSYTLTARTETCEASTESLDIEVLPAVESIILSSAQSMICNGESTMLSSEFEAETYQWFYNGVVLDGADEATLLANLAGEYSLVVRIGDCISDSEIFTLEIVDAPSISTTLLNNVNICEGESVTLSASGEAESFEWFKDGTSINIFDNEITVSDAATYTLMAANGDCAADPISFEVGLTALPMVEILPLANNILCSDGSISLTVNTDAENFVWTAPDGTSFGMNQTTVVISDESMIGNIVVESINGECVSFDNILIEAGEVPNVTLQGPGNTNLCVGDSFTFSVDPGYSSYQWFRDETPTNDTGSQLQVSDTGSYFVQVTSADGCTTNTDMVLLLFNELPNAQLAVGQNQSLCDGQQLTLDAPEVADSYTWTLNGQVIANTESIDASEAGVYQLSLTTDGCISFSQEVTVSVAEELTVDFNFDSAIVICEGDVFEPNLTQDFDSYQWYLNGNPFSTNRDVVLSEAGEYFLEVNANACIGTSEAFTLTVQDLPTVELSTSGGVALCEGENITITANTTPGASLQWLVEWEPIPNATESTFTITEGGNYNLQITNNGCSVESDVIDVFFSPSPISEIEGERERTLCEGESLLLVSAEEADSYVWLLNGEEIANQNIPLLEINEAGEYALMTFLDECSTVSETVSITSLSLPNIENISDDRVLCEGESFDVEVPAGVTSFLWIVNGQGVDDLGEILTISEPGVYQLAIEDGDCTAMSNEFEVTLLELAALDGIFEDAQICAGESIDIAAPMGQVDYIWTRNGEELLETGSELNINEAGTYQLSISQGDCESMSNAFEISVLELPTIEISDLQSCIGESILLAPVSSGFDSYIWTRDGEVVGTGSELEITNESGTYQLEIAQDDCNSISNEFEVTFIALPSLNELPTELAFCAGETMTLEAPDGADTYTWTRNGVVVQDADTQIQITEAGIYQLEIGLEDCFTISEEIMVTVNDTPVAAFDFNTSPIDKFCEGYTLVLRSEPTEADSLFWFFNGNLIATNVELINVAESGDYTLVAKLGECIAESEILTLFFAPPPVLEIPTLEHFICPGGDVELSVNVDGNETFSFSWTFEKNIVATDQNITVNATGIYQVQVVSDATGCETTSEEITVSQYEVETPTLAVDENILTSSPADSYQWFLDGELIADATNMIFTVTTSGNYQVATTDANGCVMLSEMVTIQISSVASIPTLDAFEIFPNPVTELLTISMTTTNTLDLDMDITNQLGQQIWTKSLTQSGRQQLNIPVGFLVPGIYYISLRAEDGGVQTLRFVKQ